MQVATSKANVVANKANKEAYRFEIVYVAEMGWRRDGVSELTQQLHQQAVSAAAVSKEPAAMHAEFASHRAKMNSMYEALKKGWKQVAAVIRVVEIKRAQLDAAFARLISLKNH